MYKIISLNQTPSTSFDFNAFRLEDMVAFPPDPANTDYQAFKSDIEAGAELQDADGNVMSADDAKAFILTLP